MDFRDQSRHVMELYHEIDDRILSFRGRTGLRCVAGCDACCRTDGIEAYELEYLPLALSLVESGKAEAFMEKQLVPGTRGCVFLDADNKGKNCRIYPYRGLVCRLFGFAGRTGKTGAPELITCRMIKESRPDSIDRFVGLSGEGFPVVLFETCTGRLRDIDPAACGESLPIYEAALRAVRRVLERQWYQSLEG